MTNLSLSGDDVILNIATGSITLKDAKDKVINIQENTGSISSFYFDEGTFSTINAIYNESSGETIKGTDGKDYIIDDTYRSAIEAGADVFVYNSGGGNDIITDYSAAEEDIIQLGAKAQITGAKFSGDDLILSIGKGKLTVQGGASQSVTVVDENDLAAVYKKFTRNSASNGFAERWFLDDSNFSMQPSELDSILNEKSNEIVVDEKFDVKTKFAQEKIIPLTENKSDKK